MNSKIKALIEILIVVLLFIFFSYIIQSNLDFFTNMIGTGFTGMIVYVFITIIAVVIAPVSTLPLIAVPSNIYGIFVAAVLSIIGWEIGAIIAFWVSRKYGVSRIKKFLPVEKINKIEKKMPQENVFWGVVFLRMVIPVDILSYALGLFSKIKTRDYIFATLMGITPAAFLLAFLGRLPWYYQVFALDLAIIILLIGWFINKKRKKTKND